MRISFVHDWEPDYYQELTWKDGLAAALRELKRRGHELQVLTVGNDQVIEHPYFDIYMVRDVSEAVKRFNPDVILHWADLTRPNAIETFKLGKPQALCFAGGGTDAENIDLFDHFFVESEVYRKKFEEAGKSVSMAFGTNTELFTPTEQPRYFDTIFPATFATWKRHDLYAKSTAGLRSLAVGYMYSDHEQECWKTCLDNGVMVLPHVSAETLKYLYGASGVCVVTSDSSGGSQRTVLEAMAMNLPTIVTDSDKFSYDGLIVSEPNIQSLTKIIEENLHKQGKTRDYIINNWSEHTYADSLEKGLYEII